MNIRNRRKQEKPQKLKRASNGSPNDKSMSSGNVKIVKSGDGEEQILLSPEHQRPREHMAGENGLEHKKGENLQIQQNHKGITGGTVQQNQKYNDVECGGGGDGEAEKQSCVPNVSRFKEVEFPVNITTTSNDEEGRNGLLKMSSTVTGSEAATYNDDKAIKLMLSKLPAGTLVTRIWLSPSSTLPSVNSMRNDNQGGEGGNDHDGKLAKANKKLHVVETINSQTATSSPLLAQLAQPPLVPPIGHLPSILFDSRVDQLQSHRWTQFQKQLASGKSPAENSGLLLDELAVRQVYPPHGQIQRQQQHQQRNDTVDKKGRQKNVCHLDLTNDSEVAVDLSASNDSIEKLRAGYKCKICLRRFTSFAVSKLHLLVHNGAFKCNEYGCKKGFPTAQLLQEHEEAHINKKYSCGFCDKRYTRVGNLVSHEWKHTGGRSSK